MYQLFLRLVFSCFPGGQVAKLFQDSSLGNAVNIVVTRLILLMEDQVSKLYEAVQPSPLLSSPLCMSFCACPCYLSVQAAHNSSLTSLYELLVVSNYWLKCLFLHHPSGLLSV